MSELSAQAGCVWSRGHVIGLMMSNCVRIPPHREWLYITVMGLCPLLRLLIRQTVGYGQLLVRWVLVRYMGQVSMADD